MLIPAWLLLAQHLNLKIIITSSLVRKGSHQVKTLSKGRTLTLACGETFVLCLGLEGGQSPGSSFQDPTVPKERVCVCVSGIEEGG